MKLCMKYKLGDCKKMLFCLLIPCISKVHQKSSGCISCMNFEKKKKLLTYVYCFPSLPSTYSLMTTSSWNPFLHYSDFVLLQSAIDHYIHRAINRRASSTILSVLPCFVLQHLHPSSYSVNDISIKTVLEWSWCLLYAAIPPELTDHFSCAF